MDCLEKTENYLLRGIRETKPEPEQSPDSALVDIKKSREKIGKDRNWSVIVVGVIGIFVLAGVLVDGSSRDGIRKTAVVPDVSLSPSALPEPSRSPKQVFASTPVAGAIFDEDVPVPASTAVPLSVVAAPEPSQPPKQVFASTPVGGAAFDEDVPVPVSAAVPLPASVVPEPAPPPEEVSASAPGSGAAFDEEVPSVTEEEKVAESTAKTEETGKSAAPPPPRPVLVVSAFVKEGGEGGPGKAAAASGAELLLGGKTYALPARVGLTKGRSYGPGRVVLEKDGKTWFGTLAKTTVDWDGDRKTAVALEERTEPKPGTRETVRVDGVEFALRWCPSGWFRMGSRNDDSAAWDNEKPQIHVNVPSGFWTGETEVTQELWEKIMGENPSHNQKGGSFPVENVSWNMCREFVEKLNAHPGAKAAGLRFALPTEAQWEYACRAGTTGAFGGTGDVDDMGWHRSNSGNVTHPVAEKKANAWGLRDMHGNVWEWCADTWKDHPRGTLDGGAAARSPGEYRTIRGGGYWAESRVCRSSARERSYPTNRSWYGGLRLVAFPDGK